MLGQRRMPLEVALEVGPSVGPHPGVSLSSDRRRAPDRCSAWRARPRSSASLRRSSWRRRSCPTGPSRRGPPIEPAMARCRPEAPGPTARFTPVGGEVRDGVVRDPRRRASASRSPVACGRRRPDHRRGGRARRHEPQRRPVASASSGPPRSSRARPSAGLPPPGCRRPRTSAAPPVRRSADPGARRRGQPGRGRASAKCANYLVEAGCAPACPDSAPTLRFSMSLVA